MVPIATIDRFCHCVARRCGACNGTGLIRVPALELHVSHGFNNYTSAPPEFRTCRLCAFGSVFVCHHTKQQMLVPDDLGYEELAHVERDWVYLRAPEPGSFGIIQPAYVRATVIYMLAELGGLS